MEYIYTITNTVNQKVYVGRTLDFEKRKNAHLTRLRNGKHSNKDLQVDFDKYGEDGFVFNVIQKGNKLSKSGMEYTWMIAMKSYDEKHGYNSKDPIFRTKSGEKTSVLIDIEKGLPVEIQINNTDNFPKVNKESLKVGERLREKMLERNKTIKNCADAIGKTESTLSKKLRGTVPLYIEEVEKIGNYLNLSNEEKVKVVWGD